MRSLVFDSIPLELPDPVPGDEWFLDWVLRSPKQAGIHLTAGFYAYTDVAMEIGPVDTAMEYFGGIGAQALLIQKLFSPRKHVLQDYSEAAVRHMRANLPDAILSRQADSYSFEKFYAADLVGLDFGDLTVWKTREGEKHRELLDRVFGHDPKAVVFTDIACRYLHLHRERYDTLLGSGASATYDTYLSALLGRLSALYGYHLLSGYTHTWSSVMALVPYPVAGACLQPTPSTPRGIQLDLP